MTSSSRSALAAFVALAAVYSATLAPDVTFWDSGEFLAAIHSLGIPHPPGTPLYVMSANVWARIVGPLIGFARSINLFSALCAAAGCALLANLFARWMRDPYAGFAAGICAGATSSLWLSATETEVYAPAFLVAMLLLWIADQYRRTHNTHYLILLAYVAGLGWALHLTALIALPAALLLAFGDAAARPHLREFRSSLPVLSGALLLGCSAVLFMYLRAKQDPAINQGNPASLGAMLDVLSRTQYEHVSPLARQAPLYIQFGNVFEWADWQFALGLDSQQPPGWARTPVTILFALLGAYGSMTHRRIDRRGWLAVALLLVTASIGVVLYLNLKAGPSYGIGFLPDGVKHEARERDYFFILAWVSWGAWAGLGALTFCRKVLRSQGGLIVGLATAAAPLLLNWRAVDRSHARPASEATEYSRSLLSAAPDSAVVLAHGDNDTYPVWYQREVNKLRPDIITVTIPLLPTRWYREEIARRYSLLDGRAVPEWMGTEATLRVICERAVAQHRQVVGPFIPAEKRFPAGCQ